MCDIDYRIVELQLMNGDTQGEGSSGIEERPEGYLLHRREQGRARGQQAERGGKGRA